MLAAGDRAGFYLAYYAMTDSSEALLQSKIATFSGLAGGAAAFAANRFLQDGYGVNGTNEPGLYPGLYYLSQQVARAAYDAIEASATATGSTGTGKISDSVFLATAAAAWAAEGIEHLFPGIARRGRCER
jgi:hypothetical protein